uniref:Uncharacterized protein n=1 Tax=Zea mays TaxID=4577 RepID=B4FMC6_MAIZE|nr:unknown [Zea mays]
MVMHAWLWEPMTTPYYESLNLSLGFFRLFDSSFSGLPYFYVCFLGIVL